MPIDRSLFIQRNNELEVLILKFGNKYRKLITDAYKWMTERLSEWQLEDFNMEDFIRELVSKAKVRDDNKAELEAAINELNGHTHPHAVDKTAANYELQRQQSVGVANILIRDDYSVLMGFRIGKHASGMWGFPGGHLELNERFEDCAIRETEEETGVVIPSIHDVRYWTTENVLFPEENKHYVTIFMITKYSEKMGIPTPMEPDKCEDWKWFQWDVMPDNIMTGIKQLKLRNMRPPYEGYNCRVTFVA